MTAIVLKVRLRLPWPTLRWHRHFFGQRFWNRLWHRHFFGQRFWNRFWHRLWRRFGHRFWHSGRSHCHAMRNPACLRRRQRGLGGSGRDTEDRGKTIREGIFQAATRHTGTLGACEPQARSPRADCGRQDGPAHRCGQETLPPRTTR